MQVDSEKINQVTDWPIPKTPDDGRQLSGFARYYREFILDSQKIAKPLLDIMSVGKKAQGKQNVPPSTWYWGESRM